tara:strand:+ start:831 stop:1058 length:228 start_codon:yes stop_codon:yes gene_type:complete
MECNLDARGKATRLMGGGLGVLFGIGVGVMFLFDVISWPILPYICAASILGGGFSMFEGWAGWCIIRAIGIRTPL